MHNKQPEKGVEEDDDGEPDERVENWIFEMFVFDQTEVITISQYIL